MGTTYGDNRVSGQPYFDYTKEMSMTAGLLCLYGLLNLIPGVYDLVVSTVDGQDWSGNEDVYPPVVLHLAALIQVVFSLVSMAVGFQYLVSGANCVMWSKLSALLSVLSLFTLAVKVSYIGFLADKEPSIFISQSASDKENRSIATLGILGYVAYAATNFGALVHLNFKMWKFQVEAWDPYNRRFYNVLLKFFGFLTLLAGTVQLALGAYIFDKVGKERLVFPIVVGPYFVTYSEVSMAFACFQVLLGFCILWRAMMRPESEGHRARGLMCFQSFAWFVLVFSICAQVLTQSGMIRVFDPAIANGFASQLTCLVVGLGLFPIYLDAMYYTSPETVDNASFTQSPPWKKEGAEEERKTEGDPTTATGHTNV